MSKFIDVNTVRPRNDDVLLIHHSINEERTIYMREDEDRDKTFYFKVLRKGNDVKHVNIGDIVLVPWPRCVPPFEVLVDGVVKMVTITSEMELLGVLEHE